MFISAFRIWVDDQIKRFAVLDAAGQPAKNDQGVILLDDQKMIRSALSFLRSGPTAEEGLISGSASRRAWDGEGNMSIKGVKSHMCTQGEAVWSDVSNSSVRSSRGPGGTDRVRGRSGGSGRPKSLGIGR